MLTYILLKGKIWCIFKNHNACNENFKKNSLSVTYDVLEVCGYVLIC